MSEDRIDVGDTIAPVLQLVPRPAEQTKLRGWGYDKCRHQRTELDSETRAVACRDCGKALDAFDVLLEYARGERNWQHWQREQSAAAARVQQLKEEERKVKSRTQNAMRKDANAAVAAERARTERMRHDAIQAARDVAAAARRIERLMQRGPRVDPGTPEEEEKT